MKLWISTQKYTKVWHIPPMSVIMTFHLHLWICQTVLYFCVEIHNFKLKFAICPFKILSVYRLTFPHQYLIAFIMHSYETISTKQFWRKQIKDFFFFSNFYTCLYTDDGNLKSISYSDTPNQCHTVLVHYEN